MKGDVLMKQRFLAAGLSVAMALAGAIGGTLAQAADTDTWGWTSTPKNTDGSLDFSGWESLGMPSTRSKLGQLSFERNGIDYTIQVNRPSSSSANLLIANIVHNESTGENWTYSFTGGSASTSEAWYLNQYTDSNMVSREELSATPSEYYLKSQDGGLAIAVKGTASVNSGAYTLSYSEVLDITNEGRIVHHLTFTNTSGTTLTNTGFSARFDTELVNPGSAADYVPIIANGTNSVYIDNGLFRLYLGMVEGDIMEAGPWPNFFSRRDFVDVNDFAQDETVLSGSDSAVSYSLNPADLPASKSVTLAFEERLLAPVEIVPQNATVVFVDDDANGAVVTPVEGFVASRVGMPGDPIGPTEAEAAAGAPADYVVKSIDNVVYDIDPAVDQTVTVHLAHRHTTGTMQTTRTINYSGAGDATPAAVTQTLSWTTSTDVITGAVTYASAQGYPAVTSPTVAGYLAAPATVPATSATATTATRPANTTVSVAYAAKASQKVNIVWVDDENNGTVVAPAADTATTLTGLSGDPVGFAVEDAVAGTPAGYVVSTVDNVEAYDLDAAVDQTITVHLVHRHTAGTFETTRTITYSGAGDATPANNVQTLTWVTDTDAITGVVSYASLAGYPAVNVPTVAGFTANLKTVPATEATAASTTKPASSTVAVAYTANPIIDSGGQVAGQGPAAPILLAGLLLLAGVAVSRVRAPRLG